VNNPLLGIFFLAAFFLLDWEAREAAANNKY
jgi:urea transporter